MGFLALCVVAWAFAVSGQRPLGDELLVNTTTTGVQIQPAITSALESGDLSRWLVIGDVVRGRR